MYCRFFYKNKNSKQNGKAYSLITSSQYSKIISL